MKLGKTIIKPIMSKLSRDNILKCDLPLLMVLKKFHDDMFCFNPGAVVVT